MKKLLALVLALVMTLSLATVSSNAAFKDAKDIDETYAEAAAVLAGMGVFKGYTDGSFNPKGDITRAEVAAIIYRVYTADVKDSKASLYASYNKFSDMAGAGWAAGYIGYCANAAFVKGYPDGTFKPLGKVTGYEVLAMILRAVGYDQNNEFTGADWALHVAQYAQQLKILDNVKGVDLNAAATRELVAELLFRTIDKAPQVTYTPALNYNQYTTIGGKELNKTLGEDNFNLEDKDTKDEFGRPTVTWSYSTGDRQTVIAIAPIVSYTEATKNCDIYADSGLKKGTELDVYTNSKTADKDGYTIADNTTKYGAQGRLTEIYEDRVVNIDTYLAVVDKAVAEKTDSKGHVTAAYVEIDPVYGYEGKYEKKFVTDDEFKADDFVLVTIADGDIQSVVKAESKVGTLTKIAGNRKTIDSIQDVMGVDKADVGVTNTAVYTGSLREMTLGASYNFYYDTYDNVIGLDGLSTNYAVLDSLYIDRLEGRKGVDGLYGTAYFFDGEKAEDAVIDEVLGEDVSSKDIEPTSAKNDDYYYTVYSYTVDKDGAYTFDYSDFDEADGARYVAGDKFVTVYNGRTATRLQLSKNTQILLQTSESPDGKITPYTGYEKLVSFDNATDVQYLDTNGDGYVDLFYAYVEEFSTRTVFVYDTKPVSSEIDEDGNKIATMDVLELVDGELKDTTLKVYYEYIDEDSAWAGNIDSIGLFEVTEGANGVWYGVNKYVSFNIDTITKDGKRITATTWDGSTHYTTDFVLDDAKVVKYEGSFEKGTVNTSWSANKLNDNSFIFVQYDDTKIASSYDALVVYDLYIKTDVTVDGKLTKDVEYLGKDFNEITVALKEYEEIKTVEMGSEDINDFTVTYYNGETKIGSTLAAAGQKVTKAVISYAGRVYDDVEITTGKQAAASWKYLNDGEKTFASKIQSATIVSAEDGGTITVVVPESTDVTVDNLKTLLDTAKKCEFQSIEIYNTDMKTLATGDLASDMVVKVTSWDKTGSSTYNITVVAE